MKILVLLLALLPTALTAAAQGPANPRLKHELDSIAAVDQRWRVLLFDPHGRYRSDSLAAALGLAKEGVAPYLVRQMMRTDSTNIGRVRAIIRQYGYPGRSLVGIPTNEAAWYVIQHSDDIKRYLPLIKTAARRQELPFRLYAQMLDRQLMRGGQEQRYGTQGMGYTTTNPATGRREAQPLFIWPIRDAAGVNARRQQAGFDTTVEQNAANLGIPYQVLTLKDVAKMPKN